MFSNSSSLRKLRNFLPIREQGLVFEMRVRIERTQRETLPELRNSVNEALRDIQVNCRVSACDKCKARRMATPIGPPEVKTTESPAGVALFTMVAIPRSTRAQKSCQDSTSSTTNSPLTHMPMTASNICWKLLFRSSDVLGTAQTPAEDRGLLRFISSTCGRPACRTASAGYSSNSFITANSGNSRPSLR